MCGIAGILYADRERPVTASQLRAMADAIAHRGPDAEGFWNEGPVGLAHRRLSIIDLAGGAQPLGNEDGSVQVVFNGEIYNYRELRIDLERSGHRFATDSDTEVLVHLYEKDGERMVERLRGMFAFALWDVRSRRLLFARDRVGQKPLYYYRDEEKLLFGSEIKAILAHPNVDRTLDLAALEDYLTFGVIPGDRSIFRRIRKLPAAQTLLVDADRISSATARSYWRLTFRSDDSRSLEDWLAELQTKLTETVAAHRIADVPVGAFLSGGVDSSAIVAEMAKAGDAPLSTFSIGFEEREFSELPYAKAVAERFGTNHVERIVTSDAAKGLDDLTHYYDEPFADSSAIPSLAVARVAREFVKVVISGDGGDEAFGGYARYGHDLREAALRQYLPSTIRRTVVAGVGRIWPKADWLPRPMRLKTALTNLGSEPGTAYANTISICRPPLRRRLIRPEIVKTLAGRRPETIVEQAFATGDDPLHCMIAADVGTLLPDDFLTKVDRASMAAGLEVRPPFVDHELLELAARIPSRWKIRDGETKWIFKRLCSGSLPERILERRKQGFEIPVDAWLRGPLREQIRETVLSRNSRAGELIDTSVAERLYRSHARGSGRHGQILWSLLVLGRWMEEYASSCAPRESERSVASPTRQPAVATAAARVDADAGGTA